MSSLLQGASLQYVGLQEETSIYGLHAPQFQNRYFILSGPGSRPLLAFPEVIGFPAISPSSKKPSPLSVSCCRPE